MLDMVIDDTYECTLLNAFKELYMLTVSTDILYMGSDLQCQNSIETIQGFT